MLSDLTEHASTQRSKGSQGVHSKATGIYHPAVLQQARVPQLASLRLGQQVLEPRFQLRVRLFRCVRSTASGNIIDLSCERDGYTHRWQVPAGTEDRRGFFRRHLPRCVALFRLQCPFSHSSPCNTKSTICRCWKMLQQLFTVQFW
jgi:hypothetical protein